MNKKLIIAILTTFCLTTLLMIPFTRSTAPYDPWADVSGPTPGVPDGVINMRDIAYEVSLFNTQGTPIDFENTNVRIAPEKGSRPRVARLSTKAI